MRRSDRLMAVIIGLLWMLAGAPARARMNGSVGPRGGGGPTATIAIPSMRGTLAIYPGTTASLVNVPAIFHSHPFMSAMPDPAHAMQALCPATGCTYVIDPGDKVIVHSPFSLGGANQQREVRPETLIIEAGGIFSTDDDTSGNTDDGIVLMTGGELICHGHGNTGHFSGVQAERSNAVSGNQVQLNSVVTTAGGVVLNPWRSGHTYRAGQFVFDGRNTQQVTDLGGGRSGANTPRWNNTLGGTTMDGEMTWQMIQTGKIGAGAPQNAIEGCEIRGNDRASIFQVVRVSGGSGGGQNFVKNLVVGICAATSSACMQIDSGTTNSENCNGTTGYVIDPFGNSNTPAEARVCCGRPNSCASGAHANEATIVEGLWIAPVAQVAGTCGGLSPCPGQAYGVRITGNVSETIIDGGQPSDIFGNNNLAELECEGPVNNLILRGLYFEVGKDQTVSSDVVYINGCRNVTLDNDRFGGAIGAVTNCLRIHQHSGLIGKIDVRNSYISGHVCHNAIVDDGNPFAPIFPTQSYASGPECDGANGTPPSCVIPTLFDYQYTNPHGGAGARGNSQPNQYHSVIRSDGFAPEGYHSASGTALPICSPYYAGATKYVKDQNAVRCVAGAPYSPRGATCCQVQCPISGRGSWVVNGTPCY